MQLFTNTDPFFANNTHPYGFQGQEKDDEIMGEGNLYSATFWQYDSRLGRRWNIDPIYKSGISNYLVLGNNPILNIDPNGADWFRNNNGDIKWDNSRESSLGEGDSRWSNIGSTINIETGSFIAADNDTPFPFSEQFSGDKLVTNISITGIYDKNGNFSGFTYFYDKEVFATFDIDYLMGVEYPNKPNTKDGTSGNWNGESNLKLNAHVTTPDIETFGLNLIGSNVDVNQEISISLAQDGLLNIGINHGTYPSVTMNISGNRNNDILNYYRYQQHSFISSHATRFWSLAAPIITLQGGILGTAFLIELGIRQNRALNKFNLLNKKYKTTNKVKFGSFND
jgi:RHS repeat-associated protein